MRDVTDYFFSQSYKYIRWPENDADKIDIAETFMERKEKPRVVGAIDGTHIAIRRPSINEPAYLNRKGYHSLNTTVSEGCEKDTIFPF